jgi:hypothetical protein
MPDPYGVPNEYFELPDEPQQGTGRGGEGGWTDQHGTKCNWLLGRNDVLRYNPPVPGLPPLNEDVIGTLEINQENEEFTSAVYLPRSIAEHLLNALARELDMREPTESEYALALSHARQSGREEGYEAGHVNAMELVFGADECVCLSYTHDDDGHKEDERWGPYPPNHCSRPDHRGRLNHEDGLTRADDCDCGWTRNGERIDVEWCPRH